MAAHADSLESISDDQKAPVSLLSIVIPAHSEEGCITATVEHLHLELRLRNVPHEIVVVDDGSTDSTWQKLLSLREHISTVMPVQNQGPHGFGRAVEKGFSSMTGDAVSLQPMVFARPPGIARPPVAKKTASIGTLSTSMPDIACRVTSCEELRALQFDLKAAFLQYLAGRQLGER